MNGQAESREQAVGSRQGKLYKCGYSAFIGLNMVAESCGMIVPCINPPPPEQILPPKPSGLWLSYAYGRVIAGCRVGQFGVCISAKLRLWLSSSSGRKIHRQIVAVVDLPAQAGITNCNSPTIIVESVSIGGGWGSPRILLADLGYITIKAEADLVIAVAPNTAPLVSEASEVKEVRIVNYK